MRTTMLSPNPAETNLQHCFRTDTWSLYALHSTVIVVSTALSHTGLSTPKGGLSESLSEMEKK
ncbi:MAG: hypothetical protein WED07_14650 [Candidatus Freyarchaeum deiterrae]